MKTSPSFFAFRLGVFGLILAWVGSASAASPDKTPTSDPSPASELASFTIHPDFEVTLFADESLGIVDPIAIHWDHRGRLWVLCTSGYAQLRPGQMPDDKLFILEDTNGDGKADQSTLFTAGLNMPLGFALGRGGVWIASESDLLFFRDTDGDDKADEKTLILTGFGTGDTHQNISNLIFDAGGYLYFSQGLHAYSQIETPWGIARGDTAGFWRFDPRNQRLSPYGFPEMTSQNPCGIALDRWGALFVKSNDPQLCFATPALIPTTHPRELMRFAQVGQTPGKSMGGEIVSSAHLPPWIENHAIIAGYFAREVSAISLVEEGAGFQSSPPVQLIFGSHESFRPVDIRQGPDGAIYIADWYNPIINHYQVSLRHPDRDYSRGRIWRLAAKGRPLQQRPALENMKLDELVQQLRNPERWPREQARRMLGDWTDAETAANAVRTQMAKLKPEETLALSESGGVLESLNRVDAALLDQLMASDEPHVRVVAARILARTMVAPDDLAERLTTLIADPHPRPRLEAVIACANQPKDGKIPQSELFRIALGALDSGEDRFVDYSLRQTVFAMETAWRPLLENGKFRFSRPEHLGFVLETYGGEFSAQIARRELDHTSEAGMRTRLLSVLAGLGNQEDLRRVLAEAAARRDQVLLTRLAESKSSIGEAAATPLLSLLADADSATVTAALRLAGHWKVGGAKEAIQKIGTDPERSPEIRAEALIALAKVAGKGTFPLLNEIFKDENQPDSVRKAAAQGMALADVSGAARWLVMRWGSKGQATSKENATASNDFETQILLPLLLEANPGPGALAAALENPSQVDSSFAQETLNEMNRLGRVHSELGSRIDTALGRETGSPAYDATRVTAVVEAVKAGKGDPKHGREIFLRPQLACSACHQIGDEGGVIGPALNAVGAGLPLDQIVESILWPERQIKEGFQAIVLTTTSGRSITGYVQREEQGLLWYRNTTTPWIQPLAVSEIAKREAIPTLMPPQLTASLSDQEFLDLVAYLASLKG